MGGGASLTVSDKISKNLFLYSGLRKKELRSLMDVMVLMLEHMEAITASGTRIEHQASPNQELMLLCHL